MINYSNEKGVLAGSTMLLDDMKRLKDSKDSLESQCANLLMPLVDPSYGEDFNKREEVLSCAMQMHSCLKELNAIDGTYALRNDGIYKWIRPCRVDLFNYVPEEVKDFKTPDGVPLSNEIEDIGMCYEVFKQFNEDLPRDMLLRHEKDFFYDDDYMLKRIVNESIPVYTNVVGNVWNDGKDKSYKSVMERQITREYESDPYPQLPSYDEFKKLVSTTEDFGGIYKCIYASEILSHKTPIGIGGLDLTMDEMINGKTIILTSENPSDNWSKKWAETALGLIPRGSVYKIDELHYGIVLFYNKEILYDREEEIKGEYSERYYKANEAVRYFVYDRFDKEDPGLFPYHNVKYSVRLKAKMIVNRFGDEAVPDALAPSLLGDDGLVAACSDNREEILKALKNAEAIFSSCNALSRPEELNIDVRYGRFYSQISEQLPINVEQCDKIATLINIELKKYMDNRIETLKKAIIEPNNIYKMLQLLRNRLSKDGGSLLMWYQSVIQIDTTYMKYKELKELVENESKMIYLVGDCEEISDNIYYNYSNPSFIDLSSSYDILSLKNGDSIYIIKEGIYIQRNRINNISSETINVFDYNTSKMVSKEITRLHLDLPLESWCKKSNYNEEIYIVKVKS